MKKLIVLFPGVGYGFDHPLLYYADFVYETKGFERIYMRYQDIFFDTELSFEDKATKVREYVWEQAKLIDFSAYEEIVFLSKSVGSVEAGALVEKLGIKVTQIFITPIEGAVSYCDSDSRVVIGTQDDAYPIYKKHCDDNKVKVLYVKGADHSLEVAGQPYQSIDVLKEVMQFIEK